jgi:hypothetical protein
MNVFIEVSCKTEECISFSKKASGSFPWIGKAVVS